MRGVEMSREINTGGASAIELLGVAFVVLKLCGVIDWSWWWVTAPMWMPLTILILFIVWLVVTDKYPGRQ